jgi:exodeoxyribonuclease-3
VKLATWNINSVRLRIDLVAKFLKSEAPDVQAINGQKGYHGVAIVSRLPFVRSGAQGFCGKDDSRHMGVTFENGIELHDFYVPAGGDIPDPKANEKFAHKLAFLGEMATMFGKRRGKKTARAILVGDLNVAPLEHDVWSHKQLLDVVSHTPVETNLLGEVKSAFDWTDVTREFIPHDQKIYSWWSYRAQDWEESNRGRRLDHIWVGQGLKGAVTSHEIHRKIRGWQRPSDHVPVVVTIAD